METFQHSFFQHYTAESVIAFDTAHRIALNNAQSHAFDAIDHNMRDAYLVHRTPRTHASILSALFLMEVLV